MTYEQILAGKVALPDRMQCSLSEFTHRIMVAIDTELQKPLPDNALIALLCDAARLGCEYLDAVTRERIIGNRAAG